MIRQQSQIMERPTLSHMPFLGRHWFKYIIYQSYSPTANFNQRYQLMHQRICQRTLSKKKNHSLLTSLDPKFHSKRFHNKKSKLTKEGEVILRQRTQKQRKEKQKSLNRTSNEIFGPSVRDIKIFQKQPPLDLDAYK